MEVHVINFNEAGKEFTKQSFIHYYPFILFFFNQTNAKVLQSTQRAEDERVRDAAHPLRVHGGALRINASLNGLLRMQLGASVLTTKSHLHRVPNT